jgi:hypothetical protein
MHRLKRWINEAVSSYEEQLKENPIETIAISLSWVFVIIIGLMAVLAYIKFIIDGGYSLSVARIKENGAFASANFTTGTIHIISNNVVWIILGIIIGVQTIVSIILLFASHPKRVFTVTGIFTASTTARVISSILGIF